MNPAIIRLLDILFSLIGLFFLFPALLVLYIAGLLDTGSPIFVQQRVGRNQKQFFLVKFRTMRPQTESMPTHLVSAKSVTKFGSFLRRTKLDELPQLFNVLMGHMSLVGPRPNLPSQLELIEARERFGVYSVRPGITGLAQVRRIDMSTPELLAQTDAEMLEKFSVHTYLRLIFDTIGGKGSGDRIREE
ncbi:MAG: sugar transferase [Oceanospirillaceae bacterium]|nr:sugar transferase [Oceanospirillaceae bacterium]